MIPYFERSGLVHSWYDEAEVVNDRFLVCVQYTSTSFIVVAPCGENFGGKMLFRVACTFDNKGYLSCCDLFFEVGYIEEFIP